MHTFLERARFSHVAFHVVHVLRATIPGRSFLQTSADPSLEYFGNMADKHMTRVDSTLGKRDTAKAEGKRGIDVTRGLYLSNQYL